MATEQKQDTVTFVNVQKSYPPGEKLNIGYALSSDLKRSTRDWVGLFKVGWSSSRDYYTFEWAPLQPDDNLKSEVTFAGRRLPPEDNHFYQFCYVTSDGRVRGASPPFQFLAVSLARVDDLELVEIGEESLMILQPIKHNDKEKVNKLTALNESLMVEKEDLRQQLYEAGALSEKMKEKEEEIKELERQIASKRESEQRLIEKLDRERALSRELTTSKQESLKNLSDQVNREKARCEELNTAKTDLEAQLATLSQQLAEKEEAIKSLRAQLEEKKALLTELKTQMNALNQQLAEKDAALKSMQENLMAQLAAQKAETDELKGQLQTKSAQVDDLTQLQEQIAAKDAELESAKEDMDAVKEENTVLKAEGIDLRAELSDLKGQLQIKNAQVEDLSQLASTRGEEREQLAKEAEQLQERLLEVQQKRADLIEGLEAKQYDVSQLAAEVAAQSDVIDKLTKENEELKCEVACADVLEEIEDGQLAAKVAAQSDVIDKLTKENEELKVEVACAEENIAELVGAGANPVIITQPAGAPPAAHDEPPTQPPTQAAIVDKAAYDALLQAYESLESSFADSKKSNKELALKQQQAQIRSDEMVARLEQAKMEYEAIAKENYELRKRSRSPLPPQSDKPVDRQVREMESINKQLVESCEVATQQLSARKGEMKQQQARIDELERELAQTRQELEDFQDRHDEVVHTKTESLDRQQAVLDTKLKEVVELQGVAQTLEREKAKLEATVQQLRAQLTALKAAATTTDRTCPVCQTKFPGRVSQGDFERHVQAHFN